jgi:hypothetical protein
VAREARKEARLAPDAIESSVSIARRLMGPRAVTEVPRFSSTGFLTAIKGEPRIFVRQGVTDKNFVIAHEVAHWLMRRLGVDPWPGEEVFADRIGAALVASGPALLSARSAMGEKLGALSRTFDSTKSLVWLRLGEVLGDERALVSGESVRVRSQGAFPWYEPAIRLWARGRTPPGVRRAILRTGYDAGRVTLRAV